MVLHLRSSIGDFVLWKGSYKGDLRDHCGDSKRKEVVEEGKKFEGGKGFLVECDEKISKTYSGTLIRKKGTKTECERKGRQTFMKYLGFLVDRQGH